jgi:hypothetical protein
MPSLYRHGRMPLLPLKKKMKHQRQQAGTINHQEVLYCAIFLTIIGIVVILAVLWDGFETMVLPHRNLYF